MQTIPQDLSSLKGNLKTSYLSGKKGKEKELGLEQKTSLR
jgi:hypothetical protein